ncbi:hypothetical protein CB1_060782002 [Camelus ferus]|nr:hypothetical protein CB1_060782002 [Camelus ferus]
MERAVQSCIQLHSTRAAVPEAPGRCGESIGGQAGAGTPTSHPCGGGTDRLPGQNIVSLHFPQERGWSPIAPAAFAVLPLSENDQCVGSVCEIAAPFCFVWL